MFPLTLSPGGRGLALGLGLALAAGAAGAQEAAPTALPKYFNIERYQWQAEPELSAAVRRLLVRNDYGDIRTRFAGDGIVLVTAIVQRLGPTPDIGLNVERHGDALAITVVAPPGRRAVAAERPAKTDVDRADIVVYVPEKASLDAVTLRGMIETRRLKSRVDAQTDAGEIRVETEGPVRARSVTGDVTVSLVGASDAASVIETVSGNVWLTLPPGNDGEVQVQTAGIVKSAVELKDAPGANGTHRQVGGHGIPVIVRSETGAVEVQRRH